MSRTRHHRSKRIKLGGRDARARELMIAHLTAEMDRDFRSAACLPPLASEAE